MNRISNVMSKLLALGLMAALTTACQSIPPRDPAYAAVRPAAIPAAQQGNGSIYQQGFDVRLFEDQLARRVGDILTVQLSEATSASKDAATSLSKTNSNSVTNPTLLGATPQFNTPSVLPLSSNTNNNLSFGLNSDHNFDGSGSSSQSNSLSGSITVSVVEVLPNGNMVIRGEKVLQLNQGHEYVRLSGIVRKADVRPDNTVLSTQVADAQIAYSGTGAVQDTNVIGWLARFFVSALMPF